MKDEKCNLQEEPKKNYLTVANSDVFSDDSGDIEQRLAHSYNTVKYNLENGISTLAPDVDILFTGSTGSGKTSRVLTWCQKFNIKVLRLTSTDYSHAYIEAGIFDDSEEDSMEKYHKAAMLLAQPVLKYFEKNEGILFIDDADRLNKQVLNLFSDLVQPLAADNTIFSTSPIGRLFHTTITDDSIVTKDNKLLFLVLAARQGFRMLNPKDGK